MDETGEKYTKARRAVLEGAAAAAAEPRHTMPLHIDEARRLGHTYIGCEHLLLGILADENEPATKVLTAHGVTLQVARRRITEIVGEAGRDSQAFNYTPRATVVCKLAEIEAERLDGELPPSNAHLLLAMLTEGEGVPNHLFGELGLDVRKLRMDLLEALHVPAGVREVYLRQRTAYEQARHPTTG